VVVGLLDGDHTGEVVAAACSILIVAAWAIVELVPTTPKNGYLTVATTHTRTSLPTILLLPVG
jgi:hypothetical protein